MKIGIDLDNTIINYSKIWEEVAETDHNPKEKLKASLSNNEWIKIQGFVYGKKIHKASVSEDWHTLFKFLQSQGHHVEIISHKSIKSLCGTYNLQNEALIFLKNQKLDNVKTTFLETHEEKINYINQQKFSFFADDLESVLTSQESAIPLFYGSSHQFLPYFNNASEIFNFFKELQTKEVTKSSRTSFITDKYFFKYHLSKARQERDIFFCKQTNIKFKIHHNFVKTARIDNLKEISFLDKTKASLICKKIKDNTKIKCDFLAADSLVNPNLIDDLIEKVSTNPTSYREYLLAVIHKLDFQYTMIKNPVYTNPDLHPENIKFKNDQAIIFDHESAGLDDPMRALINFIHHPKNELDTHSNVIFINEFKNEFNEYLHKQNIETCFNYTSILWLDILSKNRKDIDPYIEECRKGLIFSWKKDLYEQF